MIEYPYEESMTRAEWSALAYLREKLGLETYECFSGGVPIRSECAIFDIGQSYTPDVNAFRCPYAHFRATLDLYNRDRVKLQALIMRARRMLPVDEDSDPDGLRDISNIMQLRLAVEAGNPSSIQPTEIEIGTDKSKIRTWGCTLTFDIVFLTPDV